MSKKVSLILIGLVLLGLSAAWFLTPIGELILSQLRPEAPPNRGMEAPAAMDILNTVLNALNALFGAAGLFLAAKGYRLQRPDN